MDLQREIESSLLHIFHQEGIESFSITRAAFNICEEGDRTLLVVRVNCGRATLVVPELEALFHAEPWFEVVLHLVGGLSGLHDGAVFFLAPGYDYGRNEHVTNFYYASHQAIEELRVEVLRLTNSSVRFRIDGLTGAAHGEADTLFAIDVEAMRDFDLKRSIR